MKKEQKKYIIQKWQSFYEDKGVKTDLISIYLDYVQFLVEKDLPPIFDFTHLHSLIGVDFVFLSSAVNNPESFYRTFSIPKRNGTKREITAPYPSLKYVQQWIYKNILSHVKLHGGAHGFVNNRSILTNVQVHQGNSFLLKIDLKDFFPSIHINRIIQVFKSLGYEHHVSYYLAALCSYKGILPQGSPASPMLSNIIARHLDTRLYRFAKSFNFNYSRYADDIAFSGEVINKKHIDYICDIIKDCGFTVNHEKVRLYRNSGNKILTGISLATGKPRLPRKYRRQLEKELFFIKKFGLDEHMTHNKIRKHNYLESILGKINFWLMIEPENNFAREMHDMLYQEYKKKLGAVID